LAEREIDGGKRVEGRPRFRHADLGDPGRVGQDQLDLAAGLRAGELVIDRRLAAFMAELENPRPDGLAAISERPDSDAARAIVAAALGTPSAPG